MLGVGLTVTLNGPPTYAEPRVKPDTQFEVFSILATSLTAQLLHSSSYAIGLLDLCRANLSYSVLMRSTNANVTAPSAGVG